MAVKPHVKKIVLLVWVLLVPAGFLWTYLYFPPHLGGNFADVVAFLLLTCAVAAMPMVINNVPIFLIQWVSLGVFLRFGLFVEMLFIHIALMAVFSKIKLPKEEWIRLPLNSIMFFTISLVSGLIYYGVGGQTGQNILKGTDAFLYAALYAVLIYVINQIILMFYSYTLYPEKQPFFGKDFVWDIVTTLITFPIGFVLYTLYSELGILALLLVGVPFASLSIILNLYYSSQKINEYLQKATEIGHQLAERVQVNDVMDLFIQKLMEMLPVDFAYILDVIDQKELQLIRRIEDGETLPSNLLPLKKSEGIGGRVWPQGNLSCFHQEENGKI
ncbi:hypothetical protein RCG23_18150 [Neobacillus sp. PS3-34]|uniref:hypothetical protein n=1 Tax=Neobacillus sp. PS3-34 TaxID=3070678 RepID=UPI0027E036C4|nr:hypothetical protein [Neobacillus sp. PS3-34]WML47368.1 hypothetical protein RCG23_18150 [Neobacillus sp. PS3-34]